MGRPVDLGHYGIDEIDDFDEIDDADGSSDLQDNSWYVQVAAGDVKVLSREQVLDFHRLGVINGQTYVWQKGMQQWLPLSTFISQPAAPAPAPAPADECWQVLMGPGDVRVLSLEQLDDFFRLGVVDEQTHVWQAGMQEWSTLSNLIGADEEQEPEEYWYAMLGPGDVRTLSLEQLDDLFRLDVISEQTPLWQPGMSQWLPLGTVAGIEPAAPKTAVPTAPAPTLAAPTYMSSTPPLALSIGAPELKPKGGSWLIRLSIAAGLLLTLYRNDTLYSIAQAARQQRPFAQAEQRMLGGPLFGTTRSVDRMITDGGGRLSAVRVPYIVTQMHEAARTSAAAQPSHLAAAVNAQPHDQPTSAPLASETPSPESNTAKDPQVVAEPKQPMPNQAATVAAEDARSKFATVKPVSMPRAAKKSSAKGQPVFRAKGDYYDPLNPSM
jgi:hypothetical protein